MSISLNSNASQDRAHAAAQVERAAAEAKPSGPKIRSRLFTKYVALFVTVVAVALLSNGIFEVFFYYREHKAALIRIQHEQAEAAAAKISQFIKEIESQLGWTTQLPWSAGSIEQRRFDALRLLRQVPAVTELAQVDSTGKERLRVSRLAMDVVDSGLDLSKDPKFTEAVAHKVYYGPVYFRRESEPYMTLALAGTRKDAGVSIAEVNLKLIWDVVSQIKVGENGHAYVVGPGGRLIAHPDISLVLRNTDMSKLAQVQAARAGTDGEALEGTKNIKGQEVLTASAPITPLGWTMFVELPVEEAYASLYAALQRLAIVLVAASLFAVLAGVFLARRMVGPIQALRAGAERMGSGNFAQHISIKTGDELEGLANQFNDMGARLQESYADLEEKVESRTSELSESLDQQTATAEVLSSISGSMTDTKPVFDAIVRNLLRLFGTRFAVVQTLHDGMIEMPAVQGDPGFEKLIERYPRPLADDTVGGQAMLLKQTIQFFPVLGNPAAPTATQQFARDFGFDSVIFTPMLLGDKVVGAIGAARHDPVGFDEKQIELVTNFAKQAVIAIENARLLRELHARTDDLSEALQQQTTTADVLKVISRSAFDLKSVLTTLTESAKSLCGASLGIITLRDGEVMRLRAESGCTQAFVEFMDAHPIKPGRETITGRVFMDGTPVHVADVELDTEYNFGNAPAIGAYRAVLAVPLMRDGVVEGVLLLGRPMPGPFNQRQVDLVQTFADQAVIAIENVRLFEQVQERTRELSLSLEELGTAQDRLVQTEKLASLGQLTAGIAHEIKNPLNFVNNFSALSAELVDELNELLGSTALDGKIAKISTNSHRCSRATSTRSSNTASAPTQSSRTCCCIRVKVRASIGLPTSTQSSKTVSTLPIMVRERRNPASISPCSATSTPMQA